MEIFGGSLAKLIEKTKGRYDEVLGSHGNAPLPADQLEKVYAAWEKVMRCRKNESDPEKEGIKVTEEELNGMTVLNFDCADCYFYCSN